MIPSVTEDNQELIYRHDKKIVLEGWEKEIFDILCQANQSLQKQSVLRVAGGWVRDKLLGQTSHDIDIAVDNMTGSEFASELPGWLREHGYTSSSVWVVKMNAEKSKHLETATLKINGHSIDLVNLRKEVYTSDSRVPQIAIGTPSEDAFRRDLTINSLFYNLNTRCIEDFTKMGVSDLELGKCRTPLDSQVTFSDDPLRVLRSIRFATRLRYSIDTHLSNAASSDRVSDLLRLKVSKERVGSEVIKMLSESMIQASEAVALLLSMKLIKNIFNLFIERDSIIKYTDVAKFPESMYLLVSKPGLYESMTSMEGKSISKLFGTPISSEKADMLILPPPLNETEECSSSDENEGEVLSEVRYHTFIDRLMENGQQIMCLGNLVEHSSFFLKCLESCDFKSIEQQIDPLVYPAIHSLSYLMTPFAPLFIVVPSRLLTDRNSTKMAPLDSHSVDALCTNLFNGHASSDLPDTHCEELGIGRGVELDEKQRDEIGVYKPLIRHFIREGLRGSNLLENSIYSIVQRIDSLKHLLLRVMVSLSQGDSFKFSDDDIVYLGNSIYSLRELWPLWVRVGSVSLLFDIFSTNDSMSKEVLLLTHRSAHPYFQPSESNDRQSVVGASVSSTHYLSPLTVANSWSDDELKSMNEITQRLVDPSDASGQVKERESRIDYVGGGEGKKEVLVINKQCMLVSELVGHSLSHLISNVFERNLERFWESSPIIDGKMVAKHNIATGPAMKSVLEEARNWSILNPLGTPDQCIEYLWTVFPPK